MKAGETAQRVGTRGEARANHGSATAALEQNISNSGRIFSWSPLSFPVDFKDQETKSHFVHR